MEATSLGLKTKLGLGPNRQSTRGLYTSERVISDGSHKSDRSV